LPLPINVPPLALPRDTSLFPIFFLFLSFVFFVWFYFPPAYLPKLNTQSLAALFPNPSPREIFFFFPLPIRKTIGFPTPVLRPCCFFSECDCSHLRPFEGYFPVLSPPISPLWFTYFTAIPQSPPVIFPPATPPHDLAMPVKYPFWCPSSKIFFFFFFPPKRFLHSRSVSPSNLIFCVTGMVNSQVLSLLFFHRNAPSLPPRVHASTFPSHPVTSFLAP